MELETWHKPGSRVWHIGWVARPGSGVPSLCLGGCEHWGYQIAEPLPENARICAKARKALGKLLGERYRIVDN